MQKIKTRILLIRPYIFHCHNLDQKCYKMPFPEEQMRVGALEGLWSMNWCRESLNKLINILKVFVFLLTIKLRP